MLSRSRKLSVPSDHSWVISTTHTGQVSSEGHQASLEASVSWPCLSDLGAMV